jgi:hypothetical protein
VSGVCWEADAGLPDGGVTACFSSSQCPNGGASYCEGNLRTYWTCGDDGACLKWFTDCGNLGGLVCQDGQCQEIQCATGSDCPNGGVPYCEADVRNYWQCAPTGTCYRVFSDCAAGGRICVNGACIDADGGLPDGGVQGCNIPQHCPNGGVPYCEGNVAWSWTCTAGRCVASTIDCLGGTCVDGACQ